MDREEHCLRCNQKRPFIVRDGRLFCASCGLTPTAAQALVPAGREPRDEPTAEAVVTTARSATKGDRATAVVGAIASLALLVVALSFALDWAAKTLQERYSLRPSSTERANEPDPEVRRLRASNPELYSFLEHLPSKRMLYDASGNPKLKSGAFDWWQRCVEFGDAESRVALAVVGVCAAALLLGPLVLVLLAARRWPASSRAAFTCRAALWGTVALGWPAMPVLMHVADGDFVDSPGLPLLEALAVGAGWSAVLAFLLCAPGSWLASLRFPSSPATRQSDATSREE